MAIQEVVDVYNAQNKNYRIVLQGGDEDFDTLNNLITDDEHKTIYVLPYRFVKYFGNQEQLVNLSDEFSNQEELYYPDLWNLGKVNENVYGIPWVSHSIVLIYNKNILDSVGVIPEQINSLETLVDALKLVDENTDAYGIGLVGANHNDISWMVNQFIYGFGSSLVDESGTKVTINNNNSLDAIRFYKDVLGQYAQPTWLDDTGVEIMNYFRDQKLAFEFQGVWGITDIEKNGSLFETGIINLSNIGLSPEVGPLLLSIEPEMTQEDKEEAIRFINYMISIEAQEEIMKGEYSPEHDAYYPFRVPARNDLINSLVFIENPQYIPFTTGFENPSIDVPTAKWQTVKNNIYAPGLHAVMTNELSIEDFLKQVETEGNLILNQ
ncbi:MAG TPA: extracellular solute-binding protein [Erysipelotrichaceae bacterium]|nr:extracellular solute-binding protein [Erysipelotrichaceae bacterium]